MSPRTCSGELVLRERSGRLGDAQRVALEAHLALCESCRLLLDVGREFDRFDAPELDDGARIQSLSRGAQRWCKSGRAARPSALGRRFHKRVALLVAACVVLVGGVAAAGFGARAVLRRIEPRLFEPASTQIPTTAHPVSSPLPGLAGAARDEPTPSVAPELPADAVPAPRSTATARSVSARRRIPLPATPQTEGATEILQAASDARRRGDSQEAMTLYRTLLRVYPTSPEAGLSRVALGGLLLDHRQPREALEQFDRAASSPGGALRPEGLYGRARALAALNEGPAEKDAWKQLLREFPTCPYAETARRRLGE